MRFTSAGLPRGGCGDGTPVRAHELAGAHDLHNAGTSFDHLVKVTIFLSDRALIAQSGGLRQEILGERSPALTIVIARIYDSVLEIEAVAAA